QILKKWETPTLKEGSLLETINVELEKVEAFDAIGISSAGQINPKAGILIGSVNIPGVNGLPIKEELEAKFNVPVTIENDVNAAALGESYFGIGGEVKDFLFLAYGTGIGGAIIENGNLYYGRDAFAGEFGHMITHARGEQCNCGMQGCYERYASTRALTERARAIDEKFVDGRVIFEAWYDQHPEILNLIEEWTEEIAIGLASITHAFNPGTIVLGGGIMEQKVLRDKIQDKVNTMIIGAFKEVNLVSATLGNNSGMLGAISLHLQEK